MAAAKPGANMLRACTMLPQQRRRAANAHKRIMALVAAWRHGAARGVTAYLGDARPFRSRVLVWRKQHQARLILSIMA